MFSHSLVLRHSSCFDQVDLIEGQYLLSALSAAVYDIQRATVYGGAGCIAKNKSIFSADKHDENGQDYILCFKLTPLNFKHNCVKQ